MKDLIIIGAGVAGMSAAYYSTKLGCSVILLESVMCGGKTASGAFVEDFPFTRGITGWELSAKMLRGLEEQGIDVTYDRARAVILTNDGFSVMGDRDSYEGRGIILAAGDGCLLREIEKSTADENDGVLFVSEFKKPTITLPFGTKVDERGHVITDFDCRTQISGIFAAGSVRGKAPVSVITACADGLVAAWSAAEYIAGLESGS